MNRILVVGSSNTDLVCRTTALPRPGETVSGTTFERIAGGKGANQAVAAARAGAEVFFAGAVGDDAFGTARLDDLRADGIDVSYTVIRPDTPSGVALIVVADDGENQIVIIPGANGSVTSEQALAAIDATQPSVISLALEIPFETIDAVVSNKPDGSLVVLNAAPFDIRVAAIASGIDVLVCNETESETLLGHPVDAENAREAALAIVKLGAQAAVITLGREGAAFASGRDASIVPSPAMNVVDTTGAGDAFCGALAAWLADGESISDSISSAVCAGAIAVTRAGAQPSLPTRDEIIALTMKQPRR